MTILEKIKFEEDWLSEVSLTKENIKIAFDGIRATALEQQSCEDCISREAVRQLVCKNNDKYGYSDRFHEFIEECLQLPSVTPSYNSVKTELKSCGDCISRTDAIDALNQSVNLLEATDRIEELPPVTPQPKTGHWITDIYMFGRGRHTCSNCGKGQEYITAFCSWCGADMNGGAEE